MASWYWWTHEPWWQKQKGQCPCSSSNLVSASPSWKGTPGVLVAGHSFLEKLLISCVSTSCFLVWKDAPGKLVGVFLDAVSSVLVLVSAIVHVQVSLVSCTIYLKFDHILWVCLCVCFRTWFHLGIEDFHHSDSKGYCVVFLHLLWPLFKTRHWALWISTPVSSS